MIELKMDLGKALKEIKARNAKRVLLQLPEGLKTKAKELIEELEKNGIEVIHLIDPCFGACDLAEYEIDLLNADLVIHLGHERMIKSKKTIFVPLYYGMEKNVMKKMCTEFIQKLKERNIKKIGFGAIIQYAEYLNEFIKCAEKNSLRVFLEENRAGINGQVLGCDVSAVKKLEKKIEAIVFIGDGLFHPLAISFATNKPLLAINPFEGKIEWFNEMEKDKLLKRRILMIEKARQAQSFGILVSTKEGQTKTMKAFLLKRLIERSGKKAIIFAANLLFPAYALGIEVDCFVSTACPRIALEDYVLWKKPLINGEELKIVLGKKKIEEYCFEELY